MNSQSISCFVATLLLSTICRAVEYPPQSLYNLEVNEKNPGGKDLVLKFQEVERGKNTSTAKVNFVSGAALPSSMFIMHGLYDIAQIRKTRYFVILKEWKDTDGGWMYLAGFSQDEHVDPQKFFGLSEPLPKDKQHEFTDATIFDIVFKKQK